MKILHICETAKGGVATYINTLSGLHHDVCDTKVVVPDTHKDALKDTISCSTFRYPKRSALSVVRFVFVALKERFRFSPDIVFCHSTFSLAALFALRLVSPRTKFIYCAHGWAGTREIKNPLKARLIRLIEGALCGLAHRVVNVSHGEEQYARKYSYFGRHIVIENAVAPPAPDMQLAQLSGPENALHMLFVGRLDHQKGLDILLRAYAKARRINPALCLHVIGEAVVSAQNHGVINADLPLEGVDVLGWISSEDIDGYFAAADVLIVPSRWEAFGLVIPEALRNGTPVLVSDRSNLPSLIEEGISGFSAPLEVGAFANALVALRKDTLAAMRPACLSLFNRRYHANRLGAQILDLYKELMAK